uniref:Uncharacterized protein n=1 Tax=Chloropicon primus TaxID=1764295 RepID=A0A7S2T4I9_9CHLO
MDQILLYYFLDGKNKLHFQKEEDKNQIIKVFFHYQEKNLQHFQNHQNLLQHFQNEYFDKLLLDLNKFVQYVHKFQQHKLFLVLNIDQLQDEQKMICYHSKRKCHHYQNISKFQRKNFQKEQV